MNTTITNAADQTITATVEGEAVTITVDGVWAGSGTWDGDAIIDCAAQIGATDDETEALYDALDAALQAAADAALQAEADALLARAERIIDAIDVPDGVRLTASTEIDSDGDVLVVVQHTVGHGAKQTPEQWEAIEQAIDLAPLGLAFLSGGGLGGPSSDWASGSYQQWGRA